MEVKRMRARIIDDDTLLTMLKEGRKQKEIAEHFDVSPVAVCKRIKKLLPPPESLETLTDKEKRFVVEKAKGNTATQAVMNSYDVSSRKSAKVIGSQLMAKPGIQLAINELMEFHGIGRSYRVKRLSDHINNRDPNVSLKALDQSFKLDGSYIEKKVNFNLKANTYHNIDMREFQDQREEDSFFLLRFRNWTDTELQHIRAINALLEEEPDISDNEIAERLNILGNIKQFREEIKRRKKEGIEI
jgi:Mn-dependent DtxR family transcriptional regulator